ncbi:hypothetical protein LCGC14_1093690 [marine sediment metagenome]|uniref:Uncharacterized protein n=1 Tax=marine sediment metagenome TaxID=412755 RepID=A0A0F9MBR9_9ZZZZ
MGDLWEKALDTQRAHSRAVREATKVFNKIKRETGKEDHVTFEATIAPTREDFNKAYAAAKENPMEAEG